MLGRLLPGDTDGEGRRSGVVPNDTGDCDANWKLVGRLNDESGKDGEVLRHPLPNSNTRASGLGDVDRPGVLVRGASVTRPSSTGREGGSELALDEDPVPPPREGSFKRRA